MSKRNSKAARDRAQGKAWREAKEAVARLDWDQQRFLIRKMVADQWMRMSPKSLKQEQLKDRVASRAKKLLDALEVDLVELETAVQVERLKEYLPHLRASRKADTARGAWAAEAVKVLHNHPEHQKFANKGHKLWTGWNVKDGWRLGPPSEEVQEKIPATESIED